MAMEFKQKWSFFFAFLTITSLAIGLIVLNSENTQIKVENHQLEAELSTLNNELDYINELLDENRNENRLIKEEYNKAIEDLNQSNQYIETLENIVVALRGNETFLWSEIDFYEEAINIIGRKDVENLLIAYSIQAKELDELKTQYNELLIEYNRLLKQQP